MIVSLAPYGADFDLPDDKETAYKAALALSALGQAKNPDAQRLVDRAATWHGEQDTTGAQGINDPDTLPDAIDDEPTTAPARAY